MNKAPTSPVQKWASYANLVRLQSTIGKRFISRPYLNNNITNSSQRRKFKHFGGWYLVVQPDVESVAEESVVEEFVGEEERGDDDDEVEELAEDEAEVVDVVLVVDVVGEKLEKEMQLGSSHVMTSAEK